jgi:hypothetical protein
MKVLKRSREAARDAIRNKVSLMVSEKGDNIAYLVERPYLKDEVEFSNALLDFKIAAWLGLLEILK